MKKLFIFIILPVLLQAQFQFIPMSADFASFYSTDSTAYLEIYASIFQGNLRYVQNEDSVYSASFNSNLELKSEDKVVKELSHGYQNSTRDTASVLKFNQFVDIFKIEVPYGKYKATMQIIDNNANLKGEYVLDVETIKPDEKVFLSDIELCSHVSRDTSQNMFYKNQLKVVPNPRKIFDILQPMLYYYVELNNLPYDSDTKNYYEFEYYITDKDGAVIKAKPAVKKEIFGDMLVEVGAFNVMALAQDTYFINTKLKDLSTGQETTSRRMFYVYKPGKKQQIASESAPVDVSEVYADFTKEDLENEFQMAKYIAIREEEKVFKNLENAEAMKKFLTEFWRSRDYSQNKPVGTSRQEYLRHVEYANTNFRSMGKPGWKSDRGRVLLLYGEPDEYERFPSSMNALPYIVWIYHNLEGGQQFIFSDLDGFGEYQLIHSTYRKELQNPDWQSMIKSTGSSSSSSSF
jgi:GWxTD domain-containing protein